MSVLRKSIAYAFIGICYFLFSVRTIDGRVAGKVGGSGGNYYSGKLLIQPMLLYTGVGLWFSSEGKKTIHISSERNVNSNSVFKQIFEIIP